MPSPHEPAHLEGRIRQLFADFFQQGNKTKADVERFLKGLAPAQLGGYGGNTPCIEVRHGNTQLIVDGGSGLRSLGYEMMGGPCGKGQGEVHLLFTHFHWDHLMGLPFFTPIFVPGNVIHAYAVQPEIQDVFKTVFRKPYFPVPLENLGATIEYHVLEPRKAVKFGGVSVTPYELDHPDPCWGFRFEAGQKVFSHCVDTECRRVTAEELGPDLPLYQGVDFMLFDAQYTLMETLEKINWGHAAASIGLDIALREGVKKILFMHHDPASSDEKISAAEREARRYFESRRQMSDQLVGGGTTANGVALDWGFAREGMVIEL